MREQLFFEGAASSRKLTRFWLLLVLSAVIASAGSWGTHRDGDRGDDRRALMVPILGIVVAVVLADRHNLLRSLVLVVSGAAAVVIVAFLMGLVVETPVLAATNAQVAARVSPRLIDLLAALATGAVGSIALAGEDISDTLRRRRHRHLAGAPVGGGRPALEAGAPAQAVGARSCS